MSLPNFTVLAIDAPWSEVARIYRRISLLRSLGRTGEANELRGTAFAAAVAGARNSHDGPDDFDTRLEAMQAVEDARLAESTAFAELLAPLLAKMLAERLGSSGLLAAQSAPAEAAASSGAGSAPSASPRPASIADFIDDMLAQDRRPR